MRWPRLWRRRRTTVFGAVELPTYRPGSWAQTAMPPPPTSVRLGFADGSEYELDDSRDSRRLLEAARRLAAVSDSHDLSQPFGVSVQEPTGTAEN